MTSATTPRTASAVARASTGGLVVLAAIVSALFHYKWGGSLRARSAVHASGRLSMLA
ncbi:MAG TPA: hypothetical protein VGH28_16355 [Polyangiaceae bacterium]|jgi:hypothetical protein